MRSEARRKTVRVAAWLQRNLPRIPEDWYEQAVYELTEICDGRYPESFESTFGRYEHVRGTFALLLYLADVPTEDYRDIFSMAWECKHRQVIDAACSRVQLRAMFRKAKMGLPADAPDTVTIYRGTSALHFHEAAKGLSWTMDRRIACWFATRFASGNGRPLVLRADVPRDNVVYFSHGRSECEAVCFNPGRPIVDGCESEWQSVSDLWNDKRMGKTIGDTEDSPLCMESWAEIEAYMT